VLRLYVNGVLRAEAAEPTPIDVTNDVAIQIGRISGAGNFQDFAGRIDELAIYGRALSESEIETIYDASAAGKCKGCLPGDAGGACAHPGQCYEASGTCDPSSGACSYAEKTAGTFCDDGDACTQTDACDAGACLGSNPVVCSALDQCHAAGTCDPATGICSDPNVPDGTACDDGHGSSNNDTCQLGICVGPQSTIPTATPEFPPTPTPTQTPKRNPKPTNTPTATPDASFTPTETPTPRNNPKPTKTPRP
jgi:hypothetical protein